MKMTPEFIERQEGWWGEAAGDWRGVHVGYLLLGLDGRAALRFSAPAICRFIPLRTEKAHPLRAAHVVPVRGKCLIKAFLFFFCFFFPPPHKFKKTRCPAFLHRRPSRIFWSLWRCRRSRPSRSIHTSAWAPVLSLPSREQKKNTAMNGKLLTS